MDITKAIIPAAGLGSRFLPYTKTIPKEMLPLMNKPAIQFSIEEALSAGIKHFTIVTSKGKSAIANHFDTSHDLDRLLQEKDPAKIDLLTELKHISNNASFSYVRQPEPLGLGHAVWLARNSIGKEHFGIFLPDDIIFGKPSAIEQMMYIARQEKASIIAVQEVPTSAVSSYGIIEVRKQITPYLFHVSSVVEKPEQRNAPSNMAIIGRYILSPKIFNSIEEISDNGQEGEIQLTDAIAHMIRKNEKVFAYKIRGTRYDIGTPLGWLKATLGCALQDPKYRPLLKQYIQELELPENMFALPPDTFSHLNHE